MPIIMGRRTFESIGKPLPGRHNIVITRNKDYKAVGAKVVSSLNDAVKAAESNDVNEFFIIGGAELFNTTLDQAQRIYLTRVHANIDGDVFFPALNREKWMLVSEKNMEADEKNEYALTFQVWEKKNS